MKGDFAVRQQEAINSVLDLATDHATLDAALKAVTNNATLVFAWVLDERGQHLSYNPRDVTAMEVRGITCLGMFTAHASVCHLSSDIITNHETEGRNARDIIVDTLLRSSRKLADPRDSNKGEQSFAVVIKAGDSRGSAEQNIVDFMPGTFGDINQKVVCLRSARAGAVTLAIDCLRALDEQAHQHEHHGLGSLAHLLGDRRGAGGLAFEIDLGDLMRRTGENISVEASEGRRESPAGAGFFGFGRRNRGEQI